MHPRVIRGLIRSGAIAGPTAGMAAGYVQANLVVLPGAYGNDFSAFCRLNPLPCPVIETTSPGVWEPRATAPGADLRTDLPRYKVFQFGSVVDEPTDVIRWWRDDLVAFLLGCSFTFDDALTRAGLPARHVEEGKNVPMFITNRPCHAAGAFQGPLVVSMRPFRQEMVARVIEITRQHPLAHGEPVHVGDPCALGIADLSRPDFGEPVTLQPHEIPVFWACGVTPQLALAHARPDLAITHSPGCMFVTDLTP